MAKSSLALPRAIQRGVALAAGLLVVLLLLEGGLQLAGRVFAVYQERGAGRLNTGGEERVVLCVGESTTALGGSGAYPMQLQRILNRQYGGGYRVVNKGEPGRDSRSIIANLEHNLERFQPQVVVAMMGANDNPQGAPIPEGFGQPSDERSLVASLRVVRLVRLLLFQAFGQGEQEEPVGGLMAGQAVDRRNMVASSEAPPGAAGMLPAPPAPVEAGPVASEIVLQLDEVRQQLEGGHAELARGLFAEIIQKTMEDDEDYLMLATAVMDAGPRADWTLDEIEKILAVQPKARIAYQLKGVAHRQRGELVEAEEAFRQALELRALGRWAVQTDNSPFLALVLMLDKQGRESEVAQLMERYSQENPEDDQLFTFMGGYYQNTGRSEAGLLLRKRANSVRDSTPNPQTQANYRVLQRELRKRGIPLVAVQYPCRGIRGLERLLDGTEGVTLVDNEALCHDAVARYGYEQVFVDSCYGDFGHGTALGNRLLAENVARAVAGL